MSLNLSDEMVFQVSRMCYNEFEAEDRERRLDQEDLQQFKRDNIKPLYPHETYLDDQESGQKTKKIRKYSCQKFCCKFSPGRFCCFESTPPDKVYRSFGLGSCLYFKFLKHLTCFLVFASVVSSVSVLLYFLASVESGVDVRSSYQNFIFAGTIGSLSAEAMRCQYSSIDNGKASFNLKCNSGTLQKGWFIYSKETLNSIQNCRLEFGKISQNQTQDTYNVLIQDDSYISSCVEEQCEITVKVKNQNSEYQYLSHTFECLDSVYMLGELEINQDLIIYITVCIDLAIILFFLLFLGSQYFAEKSQKEYFKEIELSLNDFSIKVDGFDSLHFDEQFQKFVEETDKIVQISEGMESKIVKVKIPETKYLSEAVQRRRDAYQKLFSLIQDCFFDEKIDLNEFLDGQDFIKKCYDSSDTPEYQNYRKQLTKYLIEFKKSKEIQAQQNENSKIYAYIVMVNPKYKREVFAKSTKKCFSRYFQIQGKKYQISEPPVPDMILWENKYKWTCLRVVIIWCITLGICFGSFLLVGWAEHGKAQQAQQQSYNVNCQVLFPSETYSTFRSDSKFEHCYCFHHYSNLNITTQINQNCSEWISQYLLYLGIPILISLGIVLYNLIISRFFKLMTKFQAHDDLTSELYSYIVKRTFVLVMNMGLVIILLKLKYENTVENFDFLFFYGTYEDITSDWYLEIGVMITLTLGINIFIPIFQMLLMALLKFLRRAWDQRCGCRATSQKTKQGYLELYTNDVYPIQQRYADVLAIIIITLAFGAVIPGLYIIALFSILFMMICDRFLLFRVYQRPVNYNSKLQEKIFRTVFIAIIIHCAASALMLSEPTLIAAGSQIVRIDQFVNFDNDRMQNLFSTAYILPYVILLVFLIIWAFFNATILSVVRYCYKKCKLHEMSSIATDKLNRNFFQSLNEYQTNRLKLSLEREVNQKFNQTIVKQDTFLRVDNFNNQFMKTSQRSSMRELIARRSFMKLQSRENNVDFKTISQKRMLIGKAGYEEIFDDQIFKRERKIRILDQNLRDLFRKSNNEQTNTQEPLMTQQALNTQQAFNPNLLSVPTI